MDPLTVAVDVGPLHGHRTGVGTAVHHLVDGLKADPGVAVMPYLVSARARPVPPERRLPIPAAIAVRCWARSDRPRIDRWLPGVDVIHGTNYSAPPSRLPTVVSVYDCWFLAHPDQAQPAVRRAGAVLRRAVDRGAWVHASSHATADAARQLLSTDRITVVHLGPPEPSPDHTPGHLVMPWPTGAPVVLAIGSVERRKDLPALVAAFGRLAADDPDVHLAIAGAPADDSPRLGHAIEALPESVRARVHVLGPVDQVTKGYLLHTSRLLAYPSLDEGFGFPILEAQQVGLPVVARGVGSIAEVGGDGIEMVAPGSVDDLATGLRRVLDDDEHRAKLVAEGRANLQRFSWAATTTAMIDLYRQALEDHR